MLFSVECCSFSVLLSSQYPVMQPVMPHSSLFWPTWCVAPAHRELLLSVLLGLKLRNLICVDWSLLFSIPYHAFFSFTHFFFICKEKQWSYPVLLPYRKHQSAFLQVYILTVISHEPRSQPCPLQPGYTPRSACFLCSLQHCRYWREKSEKWVSKEGTPAVPPLSCWMNALVLLG